MRSPRLGAPTVVDRVAAPIVQTAAVRMPAITMGSTSGASTSNRRWRGVMPDASAASITAGSRWFRPVTALRRIGSSA
jgi:hypothetical protein